METAFIIVGAVVLYTIIKLVLKGAGFALKSFAGYYR